MDRRIILLIVIFNLAAIGTFVFKKCYGGKSSVIMNLKIEPGSRVIARGDSIRFDDLTVGATRWKWDFGDDEYSSSKEGAHTYFNGGKYTVKVKVYGDFGMLLDSSVKIEVTEPAPVYVAAPVTVESIISGNNAPPAGRPVNYECKLKAGSYEWTIPGDPVYARVQKGSLATYTFQSPGVHTLVLTTHNPDKTETKTITVGPGTAVQKEQTRPVIKPQHNKHQRDTRKVEDITEE